MNNTKEHPESGRDPQSTHPIEPGRSDVLPIRKPSQGSNDDRGLTPPDYDEYGSAPQQDDDETGDR
jgi:hypothetical protein